MGDDPAYLAQKYGDVRVDRRTRRVSKSHLVACFVVFSREEMLYTVGVPFSGDPRKKMDTITPFTNWTRFGLIARWCAL